MKFFLMTWSLLGSLAMATPGQAVRIDEHLLGDDAEFFAVIRTERDNLGSYFKSRTKVFLEERSRTTGKSVKEVLLADSTRTIDADHNDPTTSPKVTTEVAKKDERVLLGDLMARYEVVTERKENAGGLDRFRVDAGQAIVSGESFVLLGGTTITTGVFGGRMKDVPVKLVEARDNGSAIYLKLSKEDDEGEAEAHWVCVPPVATEQLRAHAGKDEIYLMAGSFPTKESALAKAAEWRTVCREKKITGFDPEIWSVEGEGNAAKFRVVLRGSMDLIRRERFEAIGEGLGVTLKPVSSERFREWTPVK